VTLINRSTHTISGGGRVIGQNLSLENQNLIDANIAGTVLQVEPHENINTATMQASDGGTLRFVGGGSSILTVHNAGGVIQALDGSVVELRFASIIGGTLSTSGSGVIQSEVSGPNEFQDVSLTSGSRLQLLASSVANLRATFTNNGTVEQNSGVTLLENVTLAGSGVWTIDLNNIVGSTANSQTLTNDTQHTIEGFGTLRGLTLNNNGTVQANVDSATLTLSPNSFGSSNAVNNNGTMRASGGGRLLMSGSTYTNYGTFEALNASTLQMSIATLTNASAGTLTGGTYRSIDTGGGATMTLAGPAVTTIAAGTTVELSGAAATMTFAGTNLATSLESNAGTLKIVNGHSFNLAHTLTNTGTLAGDGTVVGNVMNSGIVAPGTSPGTLSITGNYTQTAAGKLQIQLASTSLLDHLAVSQSLSLAGTLSIALVGGFQPALGNEFDILNWGTHDGSFSTIQLPGLTGGLSWDTSRLYTDGVLAIGVGGVLPGDFNSDGTVNAADYTLWRNNLGATEGALLNFNGNGGLIDGTDYALWKLHYGESSLGSGAATVAKVPELASAALLLVGLMGLACSGRMYSGTVAVPWRPREVVPGSVA
jgi:hypothetical protein